MTTEASVVDVGAAVREVFGAALLRDHDHVYERLGDLDVRQLWAVAVQLAVLAGTGWRKLGALEAAVTGDGDELETGRAMLAAMATED